MAAFCCHECSLNVKDFWYKVCTAKGYTQYITQEESSLLYYLMQVVIIAKL